MWRQHYTDIIYWQYHLLRNLFCHNMMFFQSLIAKLGRLNSYSYVNSHTEVHYMRQKCILYRTYVKPLIAISDSTSTNKATFVYLKNKFRYLKADVCHIMNVCSSRSEWPPFVVSFFVLSIVLDLFFFFFFFFFFFNTPVDTDIHFENGATEAPHRHRLY